jgi:ribosomal protein L24E
MSKVAMCEVKSKEKTTKNKPPKKVQWLAMKRNGL